jgi:hypothetical protein
MLSAANRSSREDAIAHLLFVKEKLDELSFLRGAMIGRSIDRMKAELQTGPLGMTFGDGLHSSVIVQDSISSIPERQ